MIFGAGGGLFGVQQQQLLQQLQQQQQAPAGGGLFGVQQQQPAGGGLFGQQQQQQQQQQAPAAEATKPPPAEEKPALQRCPVHGDFVRLYCVEDKQSMCGMCYFEGAHAGHHVKRIDDGEAAQLLALRTFSVQTAAAREATLAKLSEAVERDLDALGADCDSTRAAIAVSFQEARDKLSARERKLLGKLDAQRRGYEEPMRRLAARAEAAREEIAALREDIEAMSDSDSDADKDAALRLLQRVHAAEKDFLRITLTRVMSARTEFHEGDVRFDEYSVAGSSLVPRVATGRDGRSLEVSWQQPAEAGAGAAPDQYVVEYREAAPAPEDVAAAAAAAAGSGIRMGCAPLRELSLRYSGTECRCTSPREFSLGYSGTECRCTLEGLKANTVYEIRVCAVFGEERLEPGNEVLRGRTLPFACDASGHACNSDGDVVHFGAGDGQGRIYCGKQKNQCKCGACDGRCGPTNGCPCDSCEALEEALFSSFKCRRGHPLVTRRAHYTCDECRRSYSSYGRRCNACDYDMCFECARKRLPEEIRSKIVPNP